MSIADVAVIGGGQAGLASAHVARMLGLTPVVLDASAGPGGSWPHYYDSLTLFSPARFSSLPGLRFPDDSDRYPLRDEVVDYLGAYAARLDAEVRFGQRVAGVTRTADGFAVATTAGTVLEARIVVGAGGGFGSPYRPPLPGLDGFTGTVLHSADYRAPTAFAGGRVVVVGAGNSAVQIAVELAGVARVTLGTRRPVRWQPQRYLGRDFYWWLARTGLDTARWGPRLAGTGALDAAGAPLHAGGVSATVPGLGYVGLERQRSFASATLRGVGRDARHVLGVLARDRAAQTAASR